MKLFLKMIYLTQPKKFNPKFEGVGCFLEYEKNFALLHRQNHKPEGNTWGIPSGKKKTNENLSEAMARELLEETGHSVELENLNYFTKIFVNFPDYDFIYHIFHVKLDKLPKIKINPEEHKDFIWVSPTSALKMSLIGDLNNCIKLFYKV